MEEACEWRSTVYFVEHTGIIKENKNGIIQ